MYAQLTRLTGIVGQISAMGYALFLLKQFMYPDTPMLALPVHVFWSLSIVILVKPMFEDEAPEPMKVLSKFFDIAAFLVCVYLMWHYISDTERIQLRLDNVDPVLFGDYVAFCVGIPLLLEAVRRSTGMGLVYVLVVFMLYGFFGGSLPGWFSFEDFSLHTFAEITILGTEGLFGVTASAIISFVFYFVLFGALFSATGGGKIFIDLAMRVTGRLMGGPAKAAIVASALFGTVSGSALANVTSTGVLTIPLMKSAGYTPEQAGATEAIASSGGQLMPPIMGVAAFVMAELLGVPYTRVALAGILPALGFYFALYLNIDLMARKQHIEGIKGYTTKDPVRPRLHLLIAPIALVAALVMGFSAPMSALIGSAAALIVPMFRANTRYPLKSIYGYLVDVGKQISDVSVPVNAVGIVIVVAIQSGLAIKFVTLLAQLGEGSLILSLLLVILGCIVLGMGLPTVAAYIIGAVMFVPALGNLGVDKLAANFFVMYYSVLSQVTPPVALAAFAAAAIAKANPYKTGWIGVKLGLVVFILPFGFVRDPALLWEGDAFHIFMAAFGILCGTSAWAIALQGWLQGLLHMPVRFVYAAICFIIVYQPTFSMEWNICVTSFIILSSMCFWAPTRKILCFEKKPTPPPAAAGEA